MYKAIIFGDPNSEIITAEDVYFGRISRNNEFVDPEYKFKVRYVKGAKNNGAAHFRLYMSREDYNNLSPERKNKYDILSTMKHYAETSWHRNWEKLLSQFCEIEKYIKDPNTNERKRADAYYEKANIVIELQHSYIDGDFENRNKFYNGLNINVVWLFNLPNANIEDDGDVMTILEDNARGFFKVAENVNNLTEHNVYIQTKNRRIYRVNNLERKEIDNELKSTIRMFKKTKVYSIEEFISEIESGEILENDNSPKDERKEEKKLKSILQIYEEINDGHLRSFTVKDDTKKYDNIYRLYYADNEKKLARNFKYGGYLIRYCSQDDHILSSTYYNLSEKDAEQEKWVLLSCSKEYR